MPNPSCEKCHQRSHCWFTDEGYLCSPCAEDLAQRQKDQAHAILIERFRKALMVAHADDWDMETVAEAAHVCAAEAMDLVDDHRVLYEAGALPSQRSGGLPTDEKGDVNGD